MGAFKIMIDAGHFAKYNRSPVLPSYYESEMTWKLAHLWKEELEKYKGVEVGMTRDDQTKDLDIVLRGHKAKGHDLFVSLHSNAPDMRNKTVEQVQGTDYPAVFVACDNHRLDELGEEIASLVAAMMDTVQHGQVHKKEWEGRPGVEHLGVLRGAQEVGGDSAFHLIENVPGDGVQVQQGGVGADLGEGIEAGDSAFVGGLARPAADQAAEHGHGVVVACHVNIGGLPLAVVDYYGVRACLCLDYNIWMCFGIKLKSSCFKVRVGIAVFCLVAESVIA